VLRYWGVDWGVFLWCYGWIEKHLTVVFCEVLKFQRAYILVFLFQHSPELFWLVFYYVRQALLQFSSIFPTTFSVLFKCCLRRWAFSTICTSCLFIFYFSLLAFVVVPWRHVLVPLIRVFAFCYYFSSYYSYLHCFFY
jgi:hypothetical protein